MALGTLGSTLNDELNRLANGGTYRDMNQMVDEALAAKQWANRENINPYSTDTVGILNEIAGLGLDKKNWLDFNGVCNYIAGTTGLPAAAALRQVYPTTDLLTGVASYYVDGYAGSNYIPTTASGYLYLPGVASNNATSPDSNALDITGDLDIRLKLAMDNWRPSAVQALLYKWNVTGNQRSYRLNLNTDGILDFAWSTAGSAAITAQSTVSTGIADGATKWIRVTLDVDNGASGNTTTFYTSDDGTNWTQLGNTVIQAGTTSIYAGTSILAIGSLVDGTFAARGEFFRVQILNGIGGTTVFDANFETAMTSQTVASFTESSSNAATVTINRNTYNFQLDTINNLGAAGSLLPTTLGSSTAADSNDPKFLDHTGTNYVYLPGVASNFLSVPDSAGLDITGDIDLRVYLAADDWTTGVANNVIIGKWGSSTNQRAYRLVLDTTGKPQLSWSTDGTASVNQLCSDAVPGVDGQPLWVRATLDVDNGASGYEVRFFTSTNGTSWTQLGTTITGVGTTSIFNSNFQLEIGATSPAVQYMAGKYFRAQIFNGIDGTKVLDVDTSTLQTGADAYIVPTTYSGAAGAFFTGTGLSLNGTAGNYVSTPDASQLDITGDIDIAVQVAMADWTPSTDSVLLAKRSGLVTQISYILYIQTNGRPGLVWSNTGTSTIAASATAAPVIADGAPLWVRATLDVDNGASGNTVIFYTSTDGTTWTQLGSPVVTAGTTSIFNSTSALEIGSQVNGTNGLANGTFYRAVVKSGIDGFTVFDATFVGVPANSLRMIESSTYKAVVTLNTTRYCTINRSSSGRKTVAVTQPTWLFGTDDYMEVNNRYMSSGTYLYLPGVSGNYASAPDSAALDITGDIDIRVKVALDDWTTPTQNTFVSKEAPGDRAYSFYSTLGALSFSWTTDGNTIIVNQSTVGYTPASGTISWVRVTHDVDNGVGGNTTTFFTSSDGTTWTQLGATSVRAGTTSIWSGAQPLGVGARSNAASPIRGKLFRAQVLNGIGGTVAFDANFETSITSLNQASFTESSANAATVTINRSGSAYRSAGITTAGYLYPGATNTFAASATDFLNFGASDSFTLIAIVRGWLGSTGFRNILSKNPQFSVIPGYHIYTQNSSVVFAAAIGDGITRTYSNDVTFTSGALANLNLIRNTTSDTLTLSTSVPVTDTTTASLASNANFVVGGTGLDLEFIAAAVFRQVLTRAQIRQISNYFANREVYL